MRWRCIKCSTVFYEKWEDLVKSAGCRYCKLLEKYKEETDLLHKLNEVDRKKLVPRYDMSYGETLIWEFLQDKGISCVKEHCFKGIPIEDHPFDFYIRDLNLCVEYDGQQHIEPSKRQGGIEGLMKRRMNDSLRTNYCRDHGISLVRLTSMHDDDTNLRILEDAMLQIWKNHAVILIGYDVIVRDTKEILP